MQTGKIKFGLLLASGLIAIQAGATEPKRSKTHALTCAASHQQINDSNNLLLLGGTAKGAMKQFAVGEFGMNVSRQKRLLGKFDRCGALESADISYDKVEAGGDFRFNMRIRRSNTGWRADYEVNTVARRDGREENVFYKQGIILFYTAADGTISSTSEKFVIQGQPGTAQTVHERDRRHRLVRSISRGVDGGISVETRYAWDDKDRLVRTDSAQSTVLWHHDRQGKELGVTVYEKSPLVLQTTTDVCQLWDEAGNCTFSYASEREISPYGMLVRDLAAGSRYEYWE